MFQFPGLTLTHKREWLSFRQTGCPIRKSPDQRLFAPTRSLSQLITSFIVSVSLGIHHTPFLTFFRQHDIKCHEVAHTFSCLAKSLNLAILISKFWTFVTLQFCLCQYVKDLCGIHILKLIGMFLVWRITDSNRWPPACKAGALASWANPP